MGFSDARSALIAALLGVPSGSVVLLHEDRDEPDKNELKRGTVDLAAVISIAKAATGGPHGQNYRASPHHDLTLKVTVHELLNIRWQGSEWYVKWYFDDDDLVFISVHRSTSKAPTAPRGPR